MSDDLFPLVIRENAECPVCQNDRHVYCDECGEKWMRCNCVSSLMACELCFGYFEWVPDNDPDKQQQLLDAAWDDYDTGMEDEIMSRKRGSRRNPAKKTNTPKDMFYGGSDDWKVGGEPTKTTYKSCDHLMTPVVFTNNGESVTIYASAGRHQSQRKPDNKPDFGLYADAIWKPVGRNEFINWPDFGTPKHDEVAAIQIVDAFIMACEGHRVEIGCIGGHGRTGTILACMGVMAGLAPAEAITFVRDTYCGSAVETNDQAAWVEWFSNHMFGEEAK